MKFKYWYLFSLIYSLLQLSCSPKNVNETADWCDQKLRSELLELQEVKIKSEWFKVYLVGDNVYAIAEPYNFQEVISYLILGTEKALLFDSGMGFDSISSVVKEITDLPLTVINSHTHYDHIGGNYEFSNILAMRADYTLKWAKNGWSHDLVKHEVAKDAFCMKMLPATDTANYHIKPFIISKFIEDEYIIDLGQRAIEVIWVPGHTPDAIALLDREAGYLWTGDTFYEATIWLFFDGTDLNDYEKSIERLGKLVPDLNKVFPAHNIPVAEPIRLVELVKAYAQIKNGKKKGKNGDNIGHPDDSIAIVFEFKNFSFLIRKDLLVSMGL